MTEISPGNGPALWEKRHLSDGRALPLHAEFADFVPRDKPITVVSSDLRPSEVFDTVRRGESLLMGGDYTRIDAIWRYVAHRSAELAPRAGRGSDAIARRQERRERARLIRAALHRLLVEVRDNALPNVAGSPDLHGLIEWVDGASDPAVANGRPFLLPFRRLQRILSDMRRRAEGIEIRALGQRITVLPHVYVPSDQSVIDLFAENAIGEVENREVLDVGTGTGVLALVAAKLGAGRVVATDISRSAVENARQNVEKLGFQNAIDVRDAGNLFTPVHDESFDLIIFNPPWIEGRPRTQYDTAICDEEHRVLRRFIRELPAHLRPGGICLLILSNATELLSGGLMALLQQLSSEAGLEMHERASITRPGRALGQRERVLLLELRLG